MDSLMIQDVFEPYYTGRDDDDARRAERAQAMRRVPDVKPKDAKAPKTKGPESPA